MRKLSFILILVILATFCLTFVGCGGEEVSDVVTIWWPSGTGLDTDLKAALDKYKAEVDPEFQYEIKVQASIDFYSNINKAILAKKLDNIPDIAFVDHVYIQALGFREYFVDLTEQLTASEKALFLDNCLTASSYNDKLYALPLSANTSALYYNTAIFAAAGVDAPPTNYEEFLEACRKIKAYSDEGQYGISPFTLPIYSNKDASFSSYILTSWFARNGASFLNSDLTASALYDVKGKDTINKINTLVTEGYINSKTYGESSFFASSASVAMIEIGQWKIGSMKSDRAIAPLFTIDGTLRNYAPLGLYSVGAMNKAALAKGASKDSCLEKQEKVVALLKYLMMDNSLQLGYNKAAEQFPALKSALADAYYSENEQLRIFSEQLAVAVGRPSTPWWPEVEGYIKRGFQDWFDYGVEFDITMDGAFGDAENSINTFLQGK